MKLFRANLWNVDLNSHHACIIPKSVAWVIIIAGYKSRYWLFSSYASGSPGLASCTLFLHDPNGAAYLRPHLSVTIHFRLPSSLFSFLLYGRNKTMRYTTSGWSMIHWPIFCNLRI